MQKSMIVLSIDCLVSQDGNVDENYYKNLAWIARYIQTANTDKYPNICLCSEGSAIFAGAIGFLIGWPHFPAIAENGAAFFDPLTNELRIHPEISSKTQIALKGITKRIALLILKKYPVLFLSPGQETSVTFTRRNINSQLSIESMRKGIRKFIAKFLKKKILKTVISKNSISIIPAGINEGKAVELLAQEKGLDLRQCIGIGISKSDISFLKKTGLIGCPQNADNECKIFVKGKKGYISQHNYAEGTADVIKWFLQIE
jgi:hydroxymethylpyrimidine pyrophosphatase-like HAD family hydrolase